MTTIEQILVRRLGGWVLVTADDWIAMPPEERFDLLGQDAVQFVAGGQILDPGPAAALLEPPVESPEPVATEPPTQLFPVSRVVAVYNRTVIEGPAFQVQRSTSQDGVKPFFQCRGRGAEYALDTDKGVAELITDLIADTLGITETIDLGVSAIAAFMESVYDIHLGDRSWSIESGDVRDHVEANAHIVLVT